MSLSTKFAPAERASPEAIKVAFTSIEVAKHVKVLINAIPNIVLVLNAERQIVYFNEQLLSDLNITSTNDITGMRPGELFFCIHSRETPGGCGTTDSCRYCGSILAILESQHGEHCTKECRMTIRKNGMIESLDLRITASPIEVDQTTYTLYTLIDISDDKRRQVLERIFFHDVLNSAVAVDGWTELGLRVPEPEKTREIIQRLSLMTKEMIDDIKAQRQLLRAENNELEIDISTFSTHGLLTGLIAQCMGFKSYEGKEIVIFPESVDLTLTSDIGILRRVLMNLLKNALEASSKGDIVSIMSQSENGSVKLTVHNTQWIPKDIQLQLFQRSFSTKGSDRGIGTYSILLLTERYLKGSVSFHSDKNTGTYFTIRIPFTLVNTARAV